MSEVCGDNRFELIGEFKGQLVNGTNIETSPEEMAVLDNFLFRIWQMGWLDKLKAKEPKPPIVKENSYGWKFYYCPSCGREFYQNNKFSFCEKCGQEVRWE